MMFESIITASTLTEYLEPVSALVDECKIHCTPEGLRIAAVDPANVAMVETSLDAAAFESYEADGGVIGLNLDQFGDVLALADDGDLVWLELDESTRKLQIEFGEVDYTQALIDPDSIRQEPDVPDIEGPSTVVIEGEKLDRGATAADLCAEHISLGSTHPGGALVIEAEGDTDDVEVTFEPDESLIDSQVTTTVRSLFSLDYVTDIVGVIDDEAEVTLNVDDEMPVTLDWLNADGHAPVSVLLSPRIASD